MTRRGIEAERELVWKLHGLGFAVIRAPASGARTKLDRPDIVAGRKGLHLALEAKTTRKRTLYIKREAVSQLLRFSERFGANPFLAVKFKGLGTGWLLLQPKELEETRLGYKVSLPQAKRVGQTLDALITGDLTQYL